MLADLAEQRIVARLPELVGSIGTALQFSEAMRTGSLGQRDLSAYLLPLGMRGGAATAATGLFRQSIDRFLGVVLVKRAIADPLGAKVADAFMPLIDGVVEAIAGWAPEDAVGVFKLERGELVSLSGGVATFQLDFSLDDQLRIQS